MTPEEFERYLEETSNRPRKCLPEDGMELAELVAGWTEAERRKLSKTAVAVHARKKQIRSEAWNNNYDGWLDLAILAVCPLSEVRKDNHNFCVFDEAALKILADRRPDWLDQIIEEKLEAHGHFISFRALRELIKAGVCRKPVSDGYVKMLSFVGFAFNQTQPRTPRSEQLLADPELLDDLWRLFEVESSYFYEGVNDYCNNPESWPETLLKLSNTGHLSRQRLIECCTRAIGSDFSSAAITGYVRFHEELALSIDELAAGQEVYLDLLSGLQTHAVPFALDQLVRLHKAKRLDGAAFLTGSGCIFALKPKGRPLQVLTLAAKVAKQSPELVPEAANLAIQALAHDSTDVQDAAVKLLAGWSSRLHRDHTSELRDKLDSLATTVRPKLEALIQELAPSDTSEPGPSAAAVVDWSKWESRVAALDPKWSSLAGANDALACARSDEVFGGIWFDVMHVPVLTSCGPIQPYESVDELLDAVAHALEVIESGDEIERILDALSRLCDQRPADFELRAAPLWKRILDAKIVDPGPGILTIWGKSKALPLLLMSWLGRPGELPQGVFDRPDGRAFSQFVDRRLSEIERRVTDRRAMPLLSAPTHEHGWIDPRVFIQRCKHYSAADQPLPLADLIQALLRLTPDHRSEALMEAADLTGERAAVIRFALGGEETDIPRDDRSFALWLTAARARQPMGNLNGLTQAAEADRRSRFLSPTFTWNTENSAEPGPYWQSAQIVDLQVSMQPKFTVDILSEFCPAVSIFEDPKGPSWWQLWARTWLQTAWPANVDALMKEGILGLRERVNSPASSVSANYIYLQPLLQPDRAWSESNDLTYLALWVALVSKDPGSRGMAVDVLIAAIEDGRAKIKADVLVKLSQADWFKLNRLAEAAREIARVSPRHAWWIAELLARFVVELQPWSGDMQHVLAVLLELFAELSLGLDDESRERLQSITPTGKSAKLLKSLSACRRSPSAKRIAAHEQALTACCERAERWSRGSL